MQQCRNSMRYKSCLLYYYIKFMIGTIIILLCSLVWVRITQVLMDVCKASVRYLIHDAHDNKSI